MNVKLYVDMHAYLRFCKVRSVSLALRNVEAALDKLEAQGVIEKAKFLTGKHLTIVPVFKQDGTIRICHYYLTVNKKLKQMSTLFPRYTELYMFSTLTGGRALPELDVSRAYQQLVLDEASKPYTTINLIEGYIGTIIYRMACQSLLLSSREP